MPEQPRIDPAIEVKWGPREPPLAPIGVVARDEVVGRLVARLWREDDPGRLRGVMGPSLLAVFGEDLPWADGVVYLGAEGGLCMPCWLRPSLPSRLVASALEGRHGRSHWVVLPPDCAFSAGEARAIRRDVLARRFEGFR